MAQDNTLGIQATVNGKEIKQGADDFIREITRMESAANQFTQHLSGKARMINGEVQSIGSTFDGVVGTIVKGAASLGAAFSAQQFASQVMRVRGEFQQLEVAFNTMLGSAEKASTLMNQLTRTAAVTPFGLQDVAGGAKQLLAYGVAAEDVNDTLVRLGDIAAGLSIPLNDLVYLYGTTMTQGRMFTQDLRQFQGRGIPLADELAKQFGVTKDKVGELVTAGKVGFEEMRKAIVSMTSEGGKFGGLMEAQSKTITGQISNIEDAIDSMFNEIGKSSEGVINIALGGVSALVENWQKVADAIGYAVSAYGAYKAAIMTQDALNNVRTGVATTEEIEGLSKLLEIKEESKNADLEAAVASGRLSQAKASELAALRAEAMQRLEVLNLKKEEAAKEAESALVAFNTAKAEKEAADERLENMQNLYEAALEQGDASYEAYAMEQLQTASASANTAATRLNTAEKNLNTASSNAKTAATTADTFATSVNTVANNANTKSIGLMKAAALQLQGILKGLWATLMANPLAIVVASVGALAYGVYKFATRESEAEKATKGLNDALENQSKKYDEHKKTIDDLVSSLGNLDLSEGTRIGNLQKLKQEYPEILKDINTENEFLREKHRILQEINKEQGKQQQEESQKLLDEAEKKLAYYQKVRDEGTSTSVVDMDGNGIATDNVVKAIDAQIEVVNKLKAEVSEPVKNTFLESLSKLKEEKIDATLEEITVALQALEGAGDNAVAPITELGYEFSKGQLKNMQLALQGEKNNRSGSKQSSKAWVEQYKKEYEAAAKAVTDFMNQNNELTEVEFERKLNELTQKRDDAKKKYEEAGGSVKSGNKEIQNEKKKNEELLSIHRQNQQDEINLMKEGTAKKIAQINLDYQKELDAYQEAKKKYGETDEVNQMKTNADLAHEKALADLRKNNQNAELQAMRDYIKEYGTFQQQKLAIAEEYAEKINNATTEGERRSLEKQRDRDLFNVDMQAAQQQVDWATVFGNLGGLLREQLQPTIDNLKKITQSEEFQKADISDQQELYGIISQLESENAKLDFKVFKEAANDLELFRNALNKYNEAIVRRNETEEKLNNTRDRIQVARANGEDTTQLENEEKELVDALSNANESVNAFSNILSKRSQDVSNSTKKIKDSLNNVSGGLSKLNSDSLQTAFEGLQDLGGVIGGKLGDALANIDPSGVIRGVLGIMDVLKNGISSIFVNLQDLVFGAINGILKDVLSGDIIVKSLESTLSGVGNILDTITFGGFSSWFGGGESDPTLERDIERLTASNEALQKAVDNLAEVMDETSVANATDVYEQQKSYLEQSMRNTQELMIRSASASNSGFLGIGGSHSTNYKINRGMNDNDWSRISRILGISVRDANDFFNLTSEQMAKIADEAPDLYGKIKSLADDGYKDASQYMDEYIEYYKQLEELENEWREKLTDSSFDSIRDEFKNALLDMESDTEDFAKNFEKLMMNAIVESFMTEKYDDMIQKWYERFGQAMEDGTLTGDEKDTLKSAWDDIVNGAMADRDAMFSAMGFDSSSSYSQEASSKGFQAMSQDTGEELNGRFTALQISNEEIKNEAIKQTVLQQLISTDTAAIKQEMTRQNQYISEIVDIQYESVGYLSEISKNTKQLYEMNERLGKIEANTRNM